MADKKIKLTKETQKEIIALAKSLNVSPKDELAPEWKKIYQEEYVQDYAEKHGEDKAQMMSVEILRARYYQKVLRTDTPFIFQIEQLDPVKMNKDKEKYMNLSGFAKRVDVDGKKILDKEPLVARITVKGKDQLTKFEAMKNGDCIKATFGVMVQNTYSYILYRDPDNSDPIEYDQEKVIDEGEMLEYVEKIVPIINVTKVFDYGGAIVGIWARPVLRATQSKTKATGVYEIIDDSVDKVFLLQNKAFTIFTTKKYIQYGPGSHVLMVVDVMKPRRKGELPAANLVMQFPSDMVTPVMSDQSVPAKPRPTAEPEDVTDEELEDTGLELL